MPIDLILVDRAHLGSTQNIHNLIYTVTLPDFDPTDDIPLPL
ncbi:hypothetical protein [Microcoleus sp. F4-D5]